MKKIKVLLISHAYVEADNLQKVEALSSFPDLEVGVLFPRQWRTWHGEEKIKNQKSKVKSADDKQTGSDYYTFTLPAYFSGDGGLYFYNPWELLKIIKAFNPDIIHLEEEPWAPLAGEVTYVVNRLRKKLIFFSWENLDVPLNFWRTSIEKYVFRHTDKALAGNRGAWERLQRRGFLGDIEILPQFGVDVGEFKVQSSKVKVEEIKKQLGLSGFVAGFVGRLALEKGLETLLRAVAKVPGEWSLLLLSTSLELPDYLQKLAEGLGIRARIKLATGVPHDKFPEYLQCMDLVVLPSLTIPTWTEQFGRVLVEAMACGVPVIGSSSGAIPEVVGEAGLIFAEGDEKALAEKISRMAQDPALREKLARTGQERVYQLYSTSVIVERTHQAYKALM